MWNAYYLTENNNWAWLFSRQTLNETIKHAKYWNKNGKPIIGIRSDHPLALKHKSNFRAFIENGYIYWVSHV